ncbi:MAG: EamA family transporter [Burkholderiales bacterium]|nr:EamA family transporter [Burkholderiales bacterium]
MTVSPAKLRWALWVGLATVVVWGANFALMKSVYSVATPAGYLFARYLVLSACAVGLLVWRYGTRWPKPARADLINLAKLGLLGHTVHVSMVNFGVHWSTAFSSSLILACGPVFTLIILRWSGIEVLRPTQVAGVGVARSAFCCFCRKSCSRAVGQQPGAICFCWWRAACSRTTPWPASR